MSLVHPIVEPQVALRATRGRFIGHSEECVALLYSDRVEFHPLEFPQNYENDSDIFKKSILAITIPQPPMTLGDTEKNVLPNLGGVFFTVGRNHDMLVMQFQSLLVILSVNAIDQTLQLQGVWGLPKKQVPASPRNTLVKAANTINHGHQHSNSSTSLNPPLSGLCLQASLPPPKPSPDGSQIFVASSHKSGQLTLLILDCFGKESIKHDVDYLDVLTLGWLSDEVVYFVYLNNKFHKKFQTLRLGSKLKQSGFLGFGGKKMVKNAFLPECHVTIATDFVPSAPDLNGCEDLVFKDYVLLGTRSGGYIRVNCKGAGSWELVQSAKNVMGTLQIDDSALLIQRAVRNSGSSRSLAPLPTEYKGVPTQNSVTPTAANQIHYSLVNDGTVHAVRGDPQVGACLCSKHNIDGDRRFRIKLLSLGQDGLVLDYKRVPMRLYKVSHRSSARIDVVPSARNIQVPLVASKQTADFIVKLGTAIYTRDPNGDDGSIHKIIVDENSSMISLPLNRPGFVKAARRDAKSMWGVFAYSATGQTTPTGNHILPATASSSFPPEIRIIEESSKSATKLKLKASFQFGSKADLTSNQISNNFSRWYINRLYPVHKNVVIVGLTSVKASPKLSWDDDVEAYKRYDDQSITDKPEWALFLLNFVGATSKSKPVQPKAHLLMRGSYPEVAPMPRPFPSSPNQLYLQVYNCLTSNYTSIRRLTVNSLAEFKLDSWKGNFFPHSMSQSPNAAVFVDDINDAFEGVFLIGQKQQVAPPTPGSGQSTPAFDINTPVPGLNNILSVDATDARSGFSIVLDGKTYQQTKIWNFDSNDSQFREFSFMEVPETRKQWLYRQEQLLNQLIRSSTDPAIQKFKVNPVFRAQYFTQTAAARRFRPLPELKAVICEGVGVGVDAEAYLKTPDKGYYAMFKIQNRKLLDSIMRLRRTILSERVGIWIPAEVKGEWLKSQEQNSIIAGTLFAAYWRLESEQQEELCEEAGVPFNLMDKLRPT